MSKRVRISNDSLNSYGTRVLTAGMNVEQYCRNPVLLYMHERGNVIGYVKDVKVENDEVTGELVFDEATELSKRCKKQFEFGSLKMVSAGLDIIELSEEPALLVDQPDHHQEQAVRGLRGGHRRQRRRPRAEKGRQTNHIGQGRRVSSAGTE